MDRNEIFWKGFENGIILIRTENPSYLISNSLNYCLEDFSFELKKILMFI